MGLRIKEDVWLAQVDKTKQKEIGLLTPLCCQSYTEKFFCFKKLIYNSPAIQFTHLKFHLLPQSIF